MVKRLITADTVTGELPEPVEDRVAEIAGARVRVSASMPTDLPSGSVWIRPNVNVDPADLASWRAMHWASTIIGSDGDDVDEWDAAVGGTDYKLTPYVDGVLGTLPSPTLLKLAPKLQGRPAVQFDGTATAKGQMMTSSTVSGSSLPETVVAIGYFDAFSVMFDSIGQGRRFSCASTAYALRLAGGTSVAIAAGEQNFLPHLFIIEYVQDAPTLEIDGELFTNPTTTSSSSNTGIIMGGHTSGSTAARFSGAIAFRAEIGGTLTSGEKASIRDWASKYYGIQMAA